MFQCKHDGRIDLKMAHELGYCEGCRDCMLDNTCDIEIIVDRSEFKQFLAEERNALTENSLIIAKSTNYDIDGLKFVVDYDEDHYSLRIEDWETSDIEFEHLRDDELDRADDVYDSMLLALKGCIEFDARTK